MMVERVVLETFKGFKNTEIDCLPFTCIAGPNSGGKTSVLQAIQLVQKLVVFSFGNQNKPDFASPGWDSNPEQLLWRAAAGDEDAIWLNKNLGDPARVRLHLSDDVQVSVKLEGRNRYKLDVLKNGKSLKGTTDDAASRAIIQDIFEMNPVYVPPLGAIPPSEQMLTRPQLQQHLNQGRVAEHWRLQLFWQWNDGNRSDFDRVVQLVKQYLPNCRVLPPRLTGEGTMGVVIEYEENGTLFNICTSGGGMRTLLNVAAVLELSQSKCIMLDEPDSHLHGTLQRDICKLLQDFSASRGIQIIAATHAPDFIAEASIDSLVWVDRTIQSGKKCTDLGQFLVELGSVTKADALRFSGADKVLFLEGAFDRRLLNRLWSLRSKNPFSDPTVLKANLPSGKGDHKHLRTVQEVMRDVFNIPVAIAAILDLDYEIVGDTNNPSTGPAISKLSRKEIENYLIDPAIFINAIMQASKRGTGRNLNELNQASVEAEFVRILETPQIRALMKTQLVPRYRDSLDRAIDPAKREQMGDDWFTDKWADRSWKIQRCPGKQVLRALRSWTRTRFGINVLDEELISGLAAFPPELEQIAIKLEAKFYPSE
jgi:energy-coupling factor transporter ATP-binding protein EcfA2